MESHDISGDKWAISLPQTTIHTLEDLLAYCKVDTAVWEVERFVVNKWEMGSKDAAAQPQVTPLYQVKAMMRPKVTIPAES
jgi:hypothetical protein